MGGQIVDASLVSAPRQRNTRAEKEADTPINLASGWAVVTEVMREGGLAVYGHRRPVSVASLGGLEVG